MLSRSQHTSDGRKKLELKENRDESQPAEFQSDKLQTSESIKSYEN